MTAEDLRRALQTARLVRLSGSEWESMADEFEDVERHHTVVAGDLVIIRVDGVYAAVEQPRTEERVVRRLDDGERMRAFVRERLEQYERMWDGCGCRIDYYA